LSPPHRELYEFVREDDTARLRSGNKADRLLQAAVHPHTLREHYSWPEHFDGYFENPELSTKLLWLKERLTRELALGAKIVVGTGIHVAGITRELPLEDSDILWVGGILREWFGERCVLCLDGSVPLTGARGRQSARTALIERWRSDPDARILLISMRACPDTINLTVPALPGIRKLFITALSFGWKPWKQFLGRFFREGQGVPVSYEVPVLDGTIDMSLLRLLREKWEALELFLAHVPLTEEERTLFSKKESLHRLIEENRSSLEYVNVIGAMMLGRGETGARARLTEEFFPGMTNAALYARSFEASREYNTSGHITRFIVEVVRKLEADGLVELERILDAGCGPLTLERSLAAPVYGVDLNAAMIETGRSASLHAGENARVGALSEMPAEWTHLFELTVCSLVLDWSSVAERTKILGELVRVTHPHGRILLTLTRTQLTEALLHAWTEALQEMDCVVIEELTGLVRALDGSNAAKERFQFWSICFSPNGRPFRAQNPDAFRLAFEVERSKIRRGDENGNSGHHEKEVLEHRGVVYREFEVVQRSGVALQAERAGELAAAHEVGRAIAAPDLGGWKFHRTPANLHWRVLQELVARGLVDVGGV
ncbi:MAG: methyltransferase domain-containing protein, partial [Patescibacteria group bacterium]|nr:methyltransferase domain-containing protein [Patescibacteria group bacterium]